MWEDTIQETDVHTHSENELQQWHLKAVYLSQVLGSYHGVPKRWVDFALSGVTGSYTGKTLYLSVILSLSPSEWMNKLTNMYM